MGLAEYAQKLMDAEESKEQEYTPSPLPQFVVDDGNTVVEQIVELPIEQLHNFPKSRYNRYALHTGEKMQELVDNIRCNGIIEPLVVRETPRGYEVVSGKNRREAAKMLGYKAVPCIIRTLEDIEALCQLNFLNVQYRDLRPSEKAFAYQLEHEQESNQGFRNDLANVTLYHDDTKLRGESASRMTKYRYRQLCRFTLDGYLDAVDDGLIKMGCATEVATLSERQQCVVWEVFFEQDADPAAYKDTTRMLKQDMVEKILVLAERTPSFTSADVEALFEEGSEEAPKKADTKLDLKPLQKKYTQLEGLPTKEVESIVDEALKMYFEAKERNKDG